MQCTKALYSTPELSYMVEYYSLLISLFKSLTKRSILFFEAEHETTVYYIDIYFSRNCKWMPISREPFIFKISKSYFKVSKKLKKFST
jgi:hypothetical protein